MMILKWITIIFVLSLFGLNAYSQTTVAEAKEKLTGRTQKIWVYTRFEKYMGSNKCKAGESWTFLRTGRVLIKKCENGEVKSEEKSWIAEQKSPLDVGMKIGETDYLILFPAAKPGDKKRTMILREKISGKEGATTDRYFFYEVD